VAMAVVPMVETVTALHASTSAHHKISTNDQDKS
jgi:hypothetical protein